MKYLLDTNICIYALKNQFPSHTKKLLSISPEDICISAITVGELEYGAAKSKWGTRTREGLYLFLSAFTIIPFTSDDAIKFGKIRAYLEKKGTPIGPYDTMIATQGITRNLTIITHNTAEFSRVPNLNLADWTTL